MNPQDEQFLAIANQLPSTRNAPLPQVYEAAKLALKECEKIDECQDWADKMAAMCSYARQADDETLLKVATKIKARAIQRCGELLRQFKASKGGAPFHKNGTRGGESPSITTRGDMARAAGLSSDQAKDALRIANIPQQEFEALIESDSPPTITELAELGTKKKRDPFSGIDYLQGKDPEDYQQKIRLKGLINQFTQMASEVDIKAAIRGTNEDGMLAIYHGITFIEQWASSVLVEFETLPSQSWRNIS